MDSNTSSLGLHAATIDPETPIQTNPPGIDPEAQETEYDVEKILDQEEDDGHEIPDQVERLRTPRQEAKKA
ncbi:hypothetical protein MMC22_006548 [Lobaria immixta]|nr:hypothetical protein [Lobaria immixta]